MKTSFLDIYDDSSLTRPSQSTMYGCVILPISITTSVLKLKKMSRQKVVQCLIEGIIKLEPDGLWGFNSLCGSIYTTALLYWIEQAYYSVGDMTTPWSGLCDNRLTQHWAARMSRICSDQLCNDGSIILLIHVHSIKSYIALISEKRFGDLHRQSKAQNMLTHVSLKVFPTLVVA